MTNEKLLPFEISALQALVDAQAAGTDLKPGKNEERRYLDALITYGIKGVDLVWLKYAMAKIGAESYPEALTKAKELEAAGALVILPKPDSRDELRKVLIGRDIREHGC